MEIQCQKYNDTASRVCQSKYALTGKIWSNMASAPSEGGQTKNAAVNLFFLSWHRGLRTSTDDMQYKDPEEKKPTFKD